jgi:nucleotide-binding universal stress UspA family protein
MRPYRIVAALDLSEYSEIVIEHALDHAARQQIPDLHMLSVVDDDADPEATASSLEALVREGLENFRAGSHWRTRIHVRLGRVDEEITRLANEIEADLIVIGHYGLHSTRGSIVERVIANANCPTLVIGLTDHPVAIDEQCVACMAVRAESEGERLFCVIHTDPDRLRLSTLLPWSGSLTRGGGVW